MTSLLRKLGAACLAVWLAAGAQAEDARPVVVELYTSQGCSSCPPADALLQEMTGRADIIPLALHVDYWDYLGWKDTMGSPAHSDRQRAYARAAGERTIYTPQMIVAGKWHVIGNKPRAVADAIRKARAEAIDLPLAVQRRGGLVQVRAVPVPGLPSDIEVVLVRYLPRYDVAIRRGENAGRTITYVNAVTEMRRIARWNGRATLTASAPLGGGDHPAVVLIQAAGPGRILAAAPVK